MYADLVDEINGDAESSVVITVHKTVRIHSKFVTTVVTHYDNGDVSLQQEGDTDQVYLCSDDAEALFLVLDAMLNS